MAGTVTNFVNKLVQEVNDISWILQQIILDLYFFDDAESITGIDTKIVKN